MLLPDKHAGEKTKDIDRDKYFLYLEAVSAANSWLREANRLKAEIIRELGDAYAGVVDGKKVVAHRPKRQYAITRLRKDYPDLTEHFMKWTTEQTFDVDAFDLAHHDILQMYQVHAFVELE